MTLRGTTSWLIVLAAVAATAPAYANDNLTGPVRAEVLEVLDGDTLKVRARMWLDQSVEAAVRLRGLDAPESRVPRCGGEKDRAEAARREVAALIGDGAVTLYDIGPDKYAGRVIARVLSSGNVDIGAYLVKRGYAKPWTGQGKKPTWCDDPRLWAEDLL